MHEGYCWLSCLTEVIFYWGGVGMDSKKRSTAIFQIQAVLKVNIDNTWHSVGFFFSVNDLLTRHWAVMFQ